MFTLTKPLVFFDLEGTGVDPYNDRIIQVAAVKHLPDGSQTEHEWLINPKVPIPQDSIEIHGISDEMVANKPTFGDLAQELRDLFFDSDLGGFNIKYYDIPMLQNEFARVGLTFDIEQARIVDAMIIYKMKDPRTLAAAYEKYVGGTFDNAHHAMADIKASIQVLQGQLNTYEDVPRSVEGIHEFCFPTHPDHYDGEGKLKYIDGKLAINFGKNRGKTLEELATTDPGYLRWILDGTFSEKVKDAVRAVL